jgi:hypothetical protein
MKSAATITCLTLFWLLFALSTAKGGDRLTGIEPFDAGLDPQNWYKGSTSIIIRQLGQQDSF